VQALHIWHVSFLLNFRDYVGNFSASFLNSEYSISLSWHLPIGISKITDDFFNYQYPTPILITHVIFYQLLYNNIDQRSI